MLHPWSGKASRGITGLCILLVASGLFLAPQPARADAPESTIAFVAVTDADLERFGTFPFDRKILAQVVHRVRAAQARAIVLKFFFNEDQASDRLLAAEAQALPTYFQMSLHGVRERPSDGRLEGVAERPNKTLLPSAAGTGFVNERTSQGNRIELEAYADGVHVKSLSLLGAELASGHRAEIGSGQLRLGQRAFPLDPKGRAHCPYAKAATPTPVSFSGILDAQSPLTERLRGKVVVIGYLAKDTPRTSLGPVRSLPIHEAYVRQVACLSQAPAKED